MAMLKKLRREIDMSLPVVGYDDLFRNLKGLNLKLLGILFPT